MLRWAHATGCRVARDTCAAAAGAGHLAVLEWAHGTGCEWDEETCNRAAAGGHLELLQWAHARGCPFGTNISLAAVLGGDLAMLQWLRDVGCAWHPRTCRLAAEVGKEYRTIDAVRGGFSVSKEQRAIPDNSIDTAKYNLITFLPRSLFEQFRRAANIYFLVISVLMVLGTYTSLFNSPLTPFSTLIPLVMVLVITMGKEGIEDLKRHRSDHLVNNRRMAEVLSTLNPGAFDRVAWRKVRVGNIVQVHNGDEIPADMVLLASSEPNGAAYVETSNIDGETNLKIRSAAPTRASPPAGPAWSSPGALHSLAMSIEYERPNPRIHFFTGTLRVAERGGTAGGVATPAPSVDSEGGGGEGGAGGAGGMREVPVDQSNVLMRGSSLKNTRWALGLVVYTGKETKIIKNARSAPSKRSNVDRVTNRIMGVIFGAMAAVTTVTLAGYLIFSTVYQSELYYLCYNPVDAPIALLAENCETETTGADAMMWFTFLILYNNFIPISLYVSLEVVNAVQADYIDQDLQMYDEEQDTPALARTSNMNADLGQVQYIFSDKTGTLTQNVMTFKRCAVGDTIYGEITEEERSKLTPMQLARVVEAPPLSELRERTPAELSFALCLALNHTVVIERDDATGDKTLQCESPDEEALVNGARQLGVEFVDREPGTVVVRVAGREQRFELLATLPFDSTRKRMSVLVRDASGRVTAYTKGADNVILERARGAANARLIAQQLGAFAEDGLRTLLLARRRVPAREYEAWAAAYREAGVAVKDRAERLAEAAAQVERDLEVLGVTAIEDKLQDDVPNTIADLGRAGIKVWVLTGDKEETAINIGYSCRLLEPHMTLIKLKERDGDPASVDRQLQGLCAHFGRLAEDDSLFQNQWGSVLRSVVPKGAKPAASKGGKRGVGEGDVEGGLGGVAAAATLPEPLLERPPARSGAESEAPMISSDALAMVVDGASLVHILGHDDKQALFLRVACMCRSVVACRVSPAQKRLLVRLVKKNVRPAPITLAIGDGANDVGMIQEAQVGVGMSGKEGRQAVNNADFAIAQFRFLRRLLLVHGHWDYRRLCKVILYSFYKNIALTFILFYYCFYSGLSGQSLYESLVYSGYNFFLALPILCVGLFDRDVNDRAAAAAPRLYRVGTHNLDLNVRVTVLWMAQAVLDSVLIFFIPVAAYGGSEAVFSAAGHHDGLYVFGTTVYSALVLCMLLKVVTITWTWNAVGAFCLAASLLLYVGFVLVYSCFVAYAYEFYGVGFALLSSAAFWLVVIQVAAVVWCVDLFITWLQSRFFPTVSHHAREFNRGLTSPEGKLMLAALATAHDDADLQRIRSASMAELSAEPSGNGAGGGGAAPELEISAQLRRDADTGRMVLSPDALRKLNDLVPGEMLRQLGIEDGGLVVPRSSYAYDHAETTTGVRTDVGEEVLRRVIVDRGGGGSGGGGDDAAALNVRIRDARAADPGAPLLPLPLLPGRGQRRSSMGTRRGSSSDGAYRGVSTEEHGT
ncbi:hypothetical protein JKP88DRAFT_310634 [Tribonema minus]|uniref:Phospholipid-transporting ATPase n=1 Tax=Tribonema minus TaxID=303371 RepID=A0A836CHZ9_9STRA|nr:hypothetical protein JKP88DRAFT_310634 [Tribonema minus]